MVKNNDTATVEMSDDISPELAKWPAILGWGLTGLFALFMSMASIAPKLLGMDVARQAMSAVGWRPEAIIWIGLVELVCVAFYIMPRTSLLGAVLTTGLLGGAMASQVRVGAPLLSHSLFGLYLGIIMWSGLWLRDRDLRQKFPWRR